MSVGSQAAGAVLPPVTPNLEARVAPTDLVDPDAALPAVDRVELSDGAMPQELHAEVEFARQRAIDLASRNRELHFSMDDDLGRLVVQVRDLDGELIRTIPTADALAIMSGQEI